MSDSESTPTGDDTPPPPTPPPPPPPPSGAAPTPGEPPIDDPGSGVDEPGSATPTGAPLIVPATPEPVIEPGVEPGIGSTTQLPSLPPTTAMRPADVGGPAGGGYPYEYAPLETYDPANVPKPWWQQPAGIAVIVIALVLIAGLIAWLLFRGGGDDDEASETSSRLIVELRDESGQPVDRGMFAGVTGPVGNEGDFTWVRPADAADGPIAGGSTGTDGRIDFEWEVDEAVVTDLDTWTAVVTLTDTVPAGWSAPGPHVDCVLTRPDADDTVVAMSVALDGADITLDRVATYNFPNYQFRLGDTVTCPLVSSPPVVVDTTTVETTIVDTTVPETTTTTTVAETTTTAPSPPPTVTVPPQPAATLWDVIVANPDLAGIMGWIEAAGLEDQFDDPNATLTLLAPSNQAIDNARTIHGPPAGPIDFDDTANLLLLVNTHLVETGALRVADIAGLPQVDVVEPGPHAVDTSTDPPTIGGAQILVADVVAANGVIHVIDTVLIPIALTP